MAFDPTRLYSALLNTRLQQKDNALYQVIRQLIGEVANIVGPSGTGGGGGGVINNFTNFQILENPITDSIDILDGGLVIPSLAPITNNTFQLLENPSPESIDILDGSLVIPGSIGSQGPIGVSLFGSLEDNSLESFDMLRPGIEKPLMVTASGFNSAVQSINSGAFTAATFDSNDWDAFGIHSTSVNTSRFTIPNGLDGYYLFIGCAQFANNATGQRVAAFRKNGSTFQPGEYRCAVNSATNTSQGQCVNIYSLVGGDFLELMMFQDTGGALNTGAATRDATNSVQCWRLNFLK